MYSLLFPLTRYKWITIALILISAAIIVGQIILADADPFISWINWGVAGLFALGLWFIMGRFHLGGVSEGKALAIAWPLMSMALNYFHLYFNPSIPFYLGLLLHTGLMCLIMVMLSIWQEEQATVRCLCIGFFIGVNSSVIPHAVLGMALVPALTYHMRSTSARNIFSIITGVIMGAWVVYCILFVFKSPEAADAMLMQYRSLIEMTDYNKVFETYTLWRWLYIALLAILVVIYSLSALLLGTGHSVRSSASIMLLSTLSIAEVIFLCIDLNNTALYLTQLAMFLCIQLTIHQANLRSSANEWWTIFILLSSIAISVLPLVIDFL